MLDLVGLPRTIRTIMNTFIRPSRQPIDRQRQIYRDRPKNSTNLRVKMSITHIKYKIIKTQNHENLRIYIRFKIILN